MICAEEAMLLRKVVLVVWQTVLPLRDVPVATACVSFFQTLGGALSFAMACGLEWKSVKKGHGQEKANNKTARDHHFDIP